MSTASLPPISPAGRPAAELLAEVAERTGYVSGFADGWRAGRDALLRDLRPGRGRADVLAAIEAEGRAWRALHLADQEDPS